MLGLLLFWSTCLAAAPQVEGPPAQLVLGKDPGFELVVRPHGEGPLRAHASTGVLTLIAVDERGSRFRFSPPLSKAPTTAQLIFWREDGEAPQLAVARVPLWGQTALEISTEPSAEVRVELAGLGYGPKTANASGRVTVPVEVPPDARAAKVLARAGAQESVRELPLRVPPQPLSTLVLSPELPRAGRPAFLCAVQARGKLEPDALSLKLSPPLPHPVAYRGAERICWELSLSEGRFEASLQHGDHPLAVQLSREVLPQDVVAAAPGHEGPTRVLEVGARVGGYFSGGSNGGPSSALVVSYVVPLGERRWRLDLEAGFKTGLVSGTSFGLGEFQSTLVAYPIGLGVRGRAVRRERWALDLGLSTGVVPFRHLTHPQRDRAFSETGWGYELSASVQGSLLFGQAEAFVEVRGALSPLTTERLRADVGGVGLSLGARLPVF